MASPKCSVEATYALAIHECLPIQTDLFTSETSTGLS